MVLQFSTGIKPVNQGIARTQRMAEIRCFHWSYGPTTGASERRPLCSDYHWGPYLIHNLFTVRGVGIGLLAGFGQFGTEKILDGDTGHEFGLGTGRSGFSSLDGGSFGSEVIFGESLL